MGRLYDIVVEYIPENQIFDVIDFFKDNDIGLLYFNSRSNMNIKIVDTNNILKNKHHNMLGGDEYTLNLKIQDQKYMVQIDEYYDTTSTGDGNNIKNDEYKKVNINDIKIEKNKNRKLINFIKFGAKKNTLGDYDENDHCGIMIIDTVNNTSTIQSVTNYTDCVKCATSQTSEHYKEYKIGDILTQIMIIISMKRNIKEIQLTDNSYLQCGDFKIPLIYLRTITYGMPYYSKYGFIPKNKYNKIVFERNIENYKKDKILTKNEFIKYFMFRNFDNKIKFENKILKYINEILIPRLKSTNSVKQILKSIINDKCKEGCYLLYNIYMRIYEDIGYITYNKKKFILDLTKSNSINAK